MRRSILLFYWLLTDALLFVGAYLLAYFLRVGFVFSTNFPVDKFLRVAIIVAPIWLLIMFGLGVFRLTRVQANAKTMSYILFSCIVALSLFSLTYYFLYEAFFSRLLLVMAGFFSFLFAALWHTAFDQFQRKLLRRSPPAYPMLVVGVTRETERVIKQLNDRRSLLVPVAILESRGGVAKEIDGVPVIGRLNKLEEAIKQYKPTHLLQCAEIEHTLNLVSLCKQHKMSYMLLPSVMGIVGFDESVETIEGLPVVAVD